MIYLAKRRLKGENIVDVAEKIGVGSQDYNLINVDEDNGNNNNKTTNNIAGLNICKFTNLILFLLLL